MTNEFVLDLMRKMTLREKIGQMYQSTYDGSLITGNVKESKNTLSSIKNGEVGSILGLNDVSVIKKLQEVAVNETKHKIPLIFCNDIIHGCRTMIPINLAMSCSWNPSLIEKACEMVGYESSHSGVNLTFSPMLDLARDPRWGRVMEGNGEDPYLSKKIAAAYIKGYHKGGIGACAKHFVGYGACVGGRDYDGVEMSTSTLFNFYLPPFREAINNGCEMVMSAFNTFNDVPVTINDYLLRHVLRKKIGFKNVVITDWGSLEEIMEHKCAADMAECAKKGILAGVDHEMYTRCYIDNLEKLVSEGIVSEKLVDEACYRVLDVKYKMGLFANPYKAIYPNPENYFLEEKSKKIAYQVASQALCLLENNGTLPLKKRQKVAFIGPFVEEKKVVGAWGGKVNFDDTITIKEALDNGNYHYLYAKGSKMFDSDEALLKEAIDVAKDADTIVLTIGEEQWMSGENHSRTSLDVISAHDALLEELTKLEKRIVLVIFSGRPLVLTKYKKLYEENKVHAILYAWFLGTMSGDAIVDCLYGKINPSGKLTMSFPRGIGQVPIYYNHLPSGRPHDDNGNNDYLMRYIDMDIYPLYPFGYGLSYSRFIYGDIILSKNEIGLNDKLQVSVEIVNDSSYKGMEVVELYISAPSGNVSRPIKELKGFKKVKFNAFEKKIVSFDLNPKDLMYYVGEKMVPYFGKYKLFVGANSSVENFKEFNLKLDK
ncbi:MAG: glycoside hydrolase family 3 C-terminal domain-containing protein [Bacilli bacterium]|nr:glycoside hydrolase family 3 C-terminal domain-containing protein [Bacilli bacterium]